MFEQYDIIIVGCGIYGCTLANFAARDNLKVLMIDKRSHIGGTSWSEVDHDTEIEYHKYGLHFFHTNSEDIWNYVNTIVPFKIYEPRLWSKHNCRLYSFPINLSTICQFFDRSFTPLEAKSFIDSQLEISEESNLEAKALASIGRPLYEAFVKHYTVKQWQTDPKELPPSTISRLPIRFNLDNRYFSDTYQGLPVSGYSQLFTKMLSNANIDIKLNTDFFDIRNHVPEDKLMVYTGPIDQFFDYKHGHLGWRTIHFEKTIYPVTDYQGCVLIFHPDQDVEYTKTVEYKHLYPERQYTSNKTLLIKEYPRSCTSSEDPYYPINTAQDKKKYAAYLEMSKSYDNVHFGGRLGTYQYIDMHQAIGMAMKDWKKLAQRWS